MATATKPRQFKVTESSVPVAGAGRKEAPNPLYDAVVTAEQNRGKAYQIPAETPEDSKLIISLLRRAGNKLDVTVQINHDETAGIVRFAVKPGERVRRARL